MRPLPLTGAFAVAVAIAFNIPFALLAQNFNYPDVLRQPAAEILAAVGEGGEALVWTWWSFAISALAQVALSVALLAIPRRTCSNALPIAAAAAMLGALAGLTQAMGLLRWTFVVPELAAQWMAADSAQRLVIEHDFALLHQFAGVAVGEHLGMLLTAMWVVVLEVAESDRAGQWRQWLAACSALLITAGAMEGLTVVTSLRIPLVEFAAPAGYAVFTVWLIAIGIARIRNDGPALGHSATVQP